jgi:nucleoside-diphosphate-sugar epimerase
MSVCDRDGRPSDRSELLQRLAIRPRALEGVSIPLFLTNALDDRELPLYASTQNRREWLHVDDHCRAIELVLERGANLAWSHLRSDAAGVALQWSRGQRIETS